MTTDATPGSLSFPDALALPTEDPEIQRVRAAVEAKLTGEDVAPVRVGRFMVLERIGEGAMGVVYAAYDAELDRKVAIKILNPTPDDRAVRVRLLREAQAMARLSHPNVIGVYEIGEFGDRGFVAMEFVRGRTLRHWRDDAPRSQREILERYQQAGRGLAAAHAAGVVHRDFKPDNVLVGVDDRVRVVDFGLARTQATEHAPTLRIGTPGYMAPEQILGESTDARSDQFAFSVALWEALVGARPFAGKTTNEVFSNVLSGSIRAPGRGVIPGWIEAALRVGLATRPEDRHATIDGLLHALATDPRRRRRRRLAIALGIAAVPAVLGALQLRAMMRAEACERPAEAIDAVWNGDVEQRVRAALTSTGAPNAATMADKSIPRLSDYVQSWRSAATATCTAIDIERTLDTDAAERATACLSERLEAVTALVDALAHADASIVDNAVLSVLQLPTPERCTDARALALDLRPPADHDARTELRRLEGELAAAETLRRLGRTSEALARLEAQVDAAAALEWPSILARIQARMAQIHTNLDSSDLPLELGEAAFLSAYRAGDDATAAMSATIVAHFFGVQKANLTEARHWDDLATAAIERMGAQGSQPELFHATAQGRLWLVAGDLEKSEAALQRALAIGEQLYGPDHLLVADALLVLANVQSRLDADAQCRATYERVYAILAAAVGEDHPWTTRALAGLGLAVHEVGDSERALELLAAALESDEQHFGPDHLNVAVDLSYGAIVLEESGDAEQAIAQLERALAIMQKEFPPDHPEIALLLGNLGRAQQSAGDLSAARATLERALAMNERSATPDDAMRESNETSLGQVVREQNEQEARDR